MGKNGSVPFLVGAPTTPKDTRCGPCACGRIAYRERWTRDTGWRWLCQACGPEPVALERRTTRAGAPMGYVPKEFGRAQHFAEVNRDLAAGTRIATRADGTVREGFRLGAHD
jgi:hypothetical protein